MRGRHGGLAGVVLFAMAFGQLALGEGEVSKAKEELSEVIRLTREVAPFVERLDEARLAALRYDAETILQSIQKHGIAHVKTMRAFQSLIDSFDAKTSFFKDIATDSTEQLVDKLVEMGYQIETERGFDESPYSQKVANLLTQQHELFLQLKDSTALPPELRRKLDELTAPLARAIAQAKEGDRPKAFAAAQPIYEAIVRLYPELEEIERSNAAFETILDIMGLNEKYADFAQIER